MRFGGTRRRWSLALALPLAACGPDLVQERRGCTDVFYDSVDAPYPRDDRPNCFPTVGPDSPTGKGGTGTCSGEGPPNVTLGWERFFYACPSCGPGVWPNDCRLLVCASDDDCPRFETDSAQGKIERIYECRKGLCQDAAIEDHPTDVVAAWDAYLLCHADEPRTGDWVDVESTCPDGTPSQERYCPLPLPDGCMQP